MQEQFDQVMTLARAVWRRRWLSLAMATVVCVLGWTAVFMLPDKYESTARIYLNTESMLKPLLRGLAVDSNVTQAAAHLMQRSLLSRPNLERVVHQTDLSLRYRTEAELAMLLTALAERIQIRVTGDRENILSVTYTDSDPRLAAAVVQRLVDIFIQEATTAAATDSQLTEKFLDRQIKEYEAKLVDAEERLKEFKREHVGLMPAEGRTYFERLETTQDELRAAELELRETRQRRDELVKQINALRQGSTHTPTGDMSLTAALDARIQALEEKLDELLLQYTEQHPDVISTRRVLEELKRQRQEELVVLKQAEPLRLMEENPVYRDLKIALGREEAAVAALAVRVQEYRARVAELNRLIDTIPKVEAELAKLNRDYDVNKRNYEGLVERRESASISLEAERNTDEVQFKIIEPPTVPVIPVGPNRLKLNTAVLAAGVAAGFGIVWLLTQIRPTFDSVRAVRQTLSYPVIGVVSMVRTAAEKRRLRLEMGSFSVAAASLILAYAAIVAYQFMA